MALQILQHVPTLVQASKYFALMADEVTDSANNEQFVICLRWVNDNLEPNEDFIGLYHVESIQADVLVGCLRDCMLRLNIDIHNCRSQCYDGAANMCGVRIGVSTQMCKEEQRALFVRCYGHALNLAAGDAVKFKACLRSLEISKVVTFEISKLLKFSPRREGIFNKIKAELSPDTAGFRTLCPT